MDGGSYAGAPGTQTLDEAKLTVFNLLYKTQTLFDCKSTAFNLLYTEKIGPQDRLTYYMKTKREEAMDLICYALRRGAVLLDMEGAPHVYPAYSLPHPVEREIIRTAPTVRELLRSLAFDSDPPPMYSVPWQQ